MSIFGDIVHKLFGKAKPDQPAPTTEATPNPAAAQAAAPATGAAPATPATPATSAAPAANAPLADVDVAAVMDQFVSESGQNLNWRVSIVDTLKALGVDSSLDHRKALAKELNYTGDTNDSATMNVWLHKQVMVALAANGGKLPPDLAA